MVNIGFLINIDLTKNVYIFFALVIGFLILNIDFTACLSFSKVGIHRCPEFAISEKFIGKLI